MSFSKGLLFLSLLIPPFLLSAQNNEDSQGIKTDVHFYDLKIELKPEEESVSGSNEIYLKAESGGNIVALNLSHHFSIDSISVNQSKVGFTHEGGLVKISLSEKVETGELLRLVIHYHGKPQKAINPPWEGGLVWNKDSLNRTWASVSCEGEGAGIWWPCKEDWSDKADSARLSFIVPSGLDLISNGNRIGKQELDKKRTLHVWEVSYPISNYNITFYLGNYSAFSDSLSNAGNELKLDYYVLDYNLHKAREHFKQAKSILRIYEDLFGPYPFPEDGYALAEAPYWGMEHQSAVAYGNNFKNDILGMDFIIIHETAHEWWGNSVTAEDHGEMWIHEAFATYSEALLFEKVYGKEKALQYLVYQQGKIKNAFPILGPLNQNFSDFPDADMYYKGSWVLHSLRSWIDNDSLWFASLKKLQEKYRHETISTEDVISFFSAETSKDLEPFFKRYLLFPEPPELLYKISKKRGKRVLSYKWDSAIADFTMPFEIETNGKKVRIPANTSWNSITLEKDIDEVRLTSNSFYYKIRNCR